MKNNGKIMKNNEKRWKMMKNNENSRETRLSPLRFDEHAPTNLLLDA